MSAPLSGITVVSVEHAVAAPYATRLMADLGATVIKIERPEGDFARGYDTAVSGMASYFVWANRGKRSVVLDLKNPEDRATLDGLIAGADVFVQNLAPEAALRAGLNADAVRATRPELIACDISGYGSTNTTDRAYDLAVQAEAGVFAVTGGDEPSKVGFSIADISAAMYALNSVLAALFRRERTGEGASIEVAMIDTLTEWIAPTMYNAVFATQPPRSARRHHAIAPYGTFTLRDGSQILIAVQNDREWLRLTSDALPLPHLARDTSLSSNIGRIGQVDRIEAEIQGCIAGMDPVAVVDTLRQHAVTVARVNTLEQVWQHAALRGRDRFEQISVPDGRAEVLGSPFHISGWQPPPSFVPGLGEAN